MGYKDGCTLFVLEDAVYVREQCGFGVCIEGGCCFVEEEEGWVFEDEAGYGEALFFSSYVKC
jgi:hypothetical protein